MALQILTIDDQSVNNFITGKMLKKYGPECDVICFEYSSSAVDYLKNCQKKGECPDMIFLDISMPFMDGWQFLDTLDLLNIDTDFNIKIYILSTTLQETERVKALAHKRLSGFYNKPLTGENIKNIFYENEFQS